MGRGRAVPGRHQPPLLTPPSQPQRGPARCRPVLPVRVGFCCPRDPRLIAASCVVSLGRHGRPPAQGTCHVSELSACGLLVLFGSFLEDVPVPAVWGLSCSEQGLWTPACLPCGG